MLGSVLVVIAQKAQVWRITWYRLPSIQQFRNRVAIPTCQSLTDLTFPEFVEHLSPFAMIASGTANSEACQARQSHLVLHDGDMATVDAHSTLAAENADAGSRPANGKTKTT